MANINFNNLQNYYVDNYNNIHLDNNSLYDKIVGSVSSFLGFRDYSLTRLATVVEQIKKRNPLNQDIYATEHRLLEKIAEQAGLSWYDWYDLSHLKDLYNETTLQIPSLQEHKKNRLKKFIERSMGNDQINTAVSLLYQTLPPTAKKAYEKAIKNIREFSFKTKQCYVERLNTLAEKITVIDTERIVEKIDQIEPMLKERPNLDVPILLNPNQKLNGTDLTILESHIKMEDMFNEFARLGLVEHNPESQVTQIALKVQQCANFNGKVLESINKNNPHSESGCLILYDVQNLYDMLDSYKYVNKAFDFFVFGYFFKSTFCHASLGYVAEEGNIETDIWASFRNNVRIISSYRYKTFGFKVDQLLTHSQDKMQQLYGNQWQNTIKRKYHDLLKEYFSANADQFKALENSYVRKIRAGLGFKNAFWGYDLNEEVMFEKTCVCSEFVIKSLIQCLMKLQNQIQEDWTQQGREKQSAPSIRSPIEYGRHLNKVAPHEIYNFLTERHLTEEIPTPMLIDQIVDYHRV